MKPAFRPRSEKTFTEGFSAHEIGGGSDHYARNELAATLGYSKVSSFNLAESKSSHALYEGKQPPKRQPEEGKEGARGKPEERFREFKESQQHSKIIEQIQLLKKIAGKHAVEEEREPKEHRLAVERKFSEKASNSAYTPQSEESVFRKKARGEESAQECFTPKLPKYTYEERFKKVGSPTSTDNSDSRSPPNKFVEAPDLRKKSLRVGIEDFSIGRTLGEGKFGVVTIARHKRTNTLIALKKIPKAMIKSHMMVEQLTLEIRLQSCLNHRNILAMYGFFDDPAHLYIVLEYMDQGTLYAQLKKNRILSERESAAIVRQMAEAVEHLHDQDIAHRDIKPENIVVCNVRAPPLRTSTSSATSAGPPSATSAARPTAAPSTTPLPRYSRARSTT